MLLACQERSLQVSVATAAMQTLANLLPLMLEEMQKGAEDLYSLLDSAHIREGWSSRPRYHRNRNGAANFDSRYCRSGERAETQRSGSIPSSSARSLDWRSRWRRRSRITAGATRTRRTR